MPNSDDEDFSEGELSTQEGELIAEDHTSDTEGRNAVGLEKEHLVEEVKEVDEPEEMEAVMVGGMTPEETMASVNQCIPSEEVGNTTP